MPGVDRRRSCNHPQYTLAEALAFLKKLEGLSSRFTKEEAAKASGHALSGNVISGTFSSKIAATKAYGLTNKVGAEHIGITRLGKELLTTGTSDPRYPKLLHEAAIMPNLFHYAHMQNPPAYTKEGLEALRAPMESYFNGAGAFERFTETLESNWMLIKEHQPFSTGDHEAPKVMPPPPRKVVTPPSSSLPAPRVETRPIELRVPLGGGTIAHLVITGGMDKDRLVLLKKNLDIMYEALGLVEDQDNKESGDAENRRAEASEDRDPKGEGGLREVQRGLQAEGERRGDGSGLLAEGVRDPAGEPGVLGGPSRLGSEAMRSDEGREVP